MQKELKQLKKLNKKEFLTLAKEYYLTSFLSLLKDKNYKRRKALLEKLHEYGEIIKEENSYYSYLLENISKIRNVEEYDRIMDFLDVLNEKTYAYFERVLLEYEEFLMNDKENFAFPYRDFQTLLERKDLKEDVKSLTFSYYDLMKYFSNEDAIYYLVPRTKFLDDQEYWGLYTIEKDNLLEEIRLCVPKIKDKKSLEECIYLYAAGIMMHKYLNRLVPDIDFSKLASYEVDIFKKKMLQKMK